MVKDVWETDNHPGLLNILNSRLGLLKKVSKHASQEKMLILVDGLIFSKIRYNIGLVGNVWLQSQYKDSQMKFYTYTKRDNDRLHTIENRALKMALGIKKHNFPTNDLLKKAGKLSILQEILYQVASNVKKILDTARPESLYRQLNIRNNRCTRQHRYETRMTRLQITEESFINTSIRVLNSLPHEILSNEDSEKFKKDLKLWVKSHVPTRP